MRVKLAPPVSRVLGKRAGPPGGDSIENILVKGHLGLSSPVCVHNEDLLIAVAGALEGNLLPVG
jgi:hypothetical protein